MSIIQVFKRGFSLAFGLVTAAVVAGCTSGSVSLLPVSSEQPSGSLLPAEAALPGPEALRTTSAKSTSTVVDGAGFNPSWLNQHVTVQDMQGVFAPATETSPLIDGMAVAIYRLQLSPTTAEPELLLDWATVPAAGNLWIGLSRWVHNTWVWRQPTAMDRLDLTLAENMSASGDLLVVILITGEDAAVLNGLEVPDSWSCFGHDIRHTRRSNHAGPATAAERWTYTAGDFIDSTPAISADGTVYVGSWDNNLHAINPDGSVKWTYVTGGFVGSSPAIGKDGTLYVGSWDKNLHAVNPDGSVKWTFPTSGFVESSPVLSAEGIVYFGCGPLYALNPDGSKLWEYAASVGASSPALGQDGTIYVGSGDMNLYAINPDGSFKWSYATTGVISDSSPAVADDGTVYVGSTDGSLYAVNPDGSFKWSYATGASIESSPAIGADGTIYIGSRDGKLHAVNPDGSSRWAFVTGDQIRPTSPAIDAAGTIYISSWDQKFYAVNPDGSVKWSYPIDICTYASAAIGSDGTVYVGDGGANLLAFGPGTI